MLFTIPTLTPGSPLGHLRQLVSLVIWKVIVPNFIELLHSTIQILSANDVFVKINKIPSFKFFKGILDFKINPAVMFVFKPEFHGLIEFSYGEIPVLYKKEVICQDRFFELLFFGRVDEMMKYSYGIIKVLKVNPNVA